MCGLRTRPRTDADPPRVELQSAGGGVSSRRPRGDNLYILVFDQFLWLNWTSAPTVTLSSRVTYRSNVRRQVSSRSLGASCPFQSIIFNNSLDTGVHRKTPIGNGGDVHNLDETYIAPASNFDSFRHRNATVVGILFTRESRQHDTSNRTWP